MQKKRGNLRHVLLDNAYREATARLAQIDLVGSRPLYGCLVHVGDCKKDSPIIADMVLDRGQQGP